MAENDTATFTLRVVISDAEIRKVRMANKPGSIDELHDRLKSVCSIGYPFVILYEDKDFNNDLCSLENMNDLGPYATVRIVGVTNAVVDSASTSSVDSHTSASNSGGLRQGSGNWPDEFVIPLFDHDIELMLSRGNAEFMESGKSLILARSAKGTILQRVVTAVYDIKAYPTESEFTAVAKALVTKHPCLREPGTRSGYDGWRNSIQFKMGNYRNDIRKAGGAELVINGGRRSRYNPDLPFGRTQIRKPRRGESNYLPNLPSGKDSSSQQEILKEECRKAHPDRNLVHTLMAETFAIRRQYIVKECPLIDDIKENWPASFYPKEVYAEFGRITNIPPDTFFTQLDNVLVNLETFFMAKASLHTETDQFHKVSPDITLRRTYVLRCLCSFLATDVSQVFKQFDEGTLQESLTDGENHPWIAVVGDPYCSPSTAVHHIIVEKQLLIRSIDTFAEAVKLLFCLFYTLDMAYPKKKGRECYVHEYIQKKLFGLEARKLSPKLTTFVNSVSLA